MLILLIACDSEKQESKNQDQSLEFISDEEINMNEKEQTLFELLSSRQTGIEFTNPIIETDLINMITYEYLYNGGGVAVGDINNDGLPDLYFSGNMVPNKLYLNLGNFKFKDITSSSGTDGGMGYKSGVTMADVNNDGFIDIYVCKTMLDQPQYRKNILYINKGDLTFADAGAQYGLDDPSFSTQAYFFDMDTDGDLDLYLLNHPFEFLEANNIKLHQGPDGKLTTVLSDDLSYISDKLFENRNGVFQDISATAGIRNEAFGLSAVIGDFNDDLKPDLYICNDYIQPDFLYINNGNKTFTDQFGQYFKHSSFSSMGSDFADINNDGLADLMTVDMTPKERPRQNVLSMVQNYDKFEKMMKHDLKAQYSMNTLQLNMGNGRFSDISLLTQTAFTDWSWSALINDFDNDGWKDIFVTNGYKRDVTNNDYVRYAMDSLKKAMIAKKITLLDWTASIPSVKLKSHLFKNYSNLYFSDVSSDWNIGHAAHSNGASYADLDGDGYLDIIINNIDEAPFILKNNGSTSRKNNFLRIVPLRNGKVWLGTKVLVKTRGGLTLSHTLETARGFQSSSEAVIHFGLNKDSIQSASILWPDGNVQNFTTQLNQTNRIEYATSGQQHSPLLPKNIFFKDKSASLPAEAIHTENNYIDFKREPLMVHKLSEEGPALAKADVNNDGLDDVFIGSSVGFASQLLLQKKDGTFSNKQNEVFEQNKSFEDSGALFFDSDGDGDQDLLVLSGGNEQKAGDAVYRHRLYLNDGKGGFTHDQNFIDIRSSSIAALAIDYDKDGDEDLIIGGRNIPGRYPETPQTFVLQNEKGRYTDVSMSVGKELSLAGMITDIKSADLNKDSKHEVVFCGEFMPIQVYVYENNAFKNVSSKYNLSQSNGWWFTIEIADINNDTYPDIIAGNLGLNSQLKASKEKPLCIYYNDFDNNGSVDPILCCYYGNTSYPLHYRDRMLDQMNFLKKKFTRYKTYSTATIDNLLSKEQLESAKQVFIYETRHGIFINQAGNSFAFKSLPRYTQISTVRSIAVLDINKDQKNDIIIGGNFYGTDAQLGRYDASEGALLLGKGDGNFDVVGPSTSGLYLNGYVRKFMWLQGKDKEFLMGVRNNDRHFLFQRDEN